MLLLYILRGAFVLIVAAIAFLYAAKVPVLKEHQHAVIIFGVAGAFTRAGTFARLLAPGLLFRWLGLFPFSVAGDLLLARFTAVGRFIAVAWFSPAAVCQDVHDLLQVVGDLPLVGR